MKPFKIPRSVFEKGVNVPPDLDVEVTCQPGETRPGVWVYYLAPDYEDPHRYEYSEFKAECRDCFWRLGHPVGSCLAFPEGIPQDLESHLFPVDKDRGIAFMGIHEADIMKVPVGISLEQSKELMERVLKKRRSLTYATVRDWDETERLMFR